jgi:hypothetical protein
MALALCAASGLGKIFENRVALEKWLGAEGLECATVVTGI